jgi:hypothetical protein
VRDYCFFEGRRMLGKHGVNVHEYPYFFGSAKILYFRPQIQLIVEHFTLAKTNHAAGEHVKTLGRIIFVKYWRNRLLPRVDARHCSRQKYRAVVADLKWADGNAHNP